MSDSVERADVPGKLLPEHEADGIRELDNDLPRWWVWLFALTTVWAFVYFVYYHVLEIGYLSADEYRLEIDPNYIRPESTDKNERGIFSSYHSVWYSPERDRALNSSHPATRSQFVEETRETDTVTYVALTNPVDIEAGKSVFATKCVACHGSHGEGGIGPNMTDNYWLHGAGMTNIVKSIKYGYPTKGMVSWRGELNKVQIIQVATYIQLLRGTNPPNQKAPQGELVE